MSSTATDAATATWWARSDQGSAPSSDRAHAAGLVGLVAGEEQLARADREADEAPAPVLHRGEGPVLGGPLARLVAPQRDGPAHQVEVDRRDAVVADVDLAAQLVELPHVRAEPLAPVHHEVGAVGPDHEGGVTLGPLGLEGAAEVGEGDPQVGRLGVGVQRRPQVVEEPLPADRSRHHEVGEQRPDPFTPPPRVVDEDPVAPQLHRPEQPQRQAAGRCDGEPGEHRAGGRGDTPPPSLASRRVSRCAPGQSASSTAQPSGRPAATYPRASSTAHGRGRWARTVPGAGSDGTGRGSLPVDRSATSARARSRATPNPGPRSVLASHAGRLSGTSTNHSARLRRCGYAASPVPTSGDRWKKLRSSSAAATSSPCATHSVASAIVRLTSTSVISRLAAARACSTWRAASRGRPTAARRVQQLAASSAV